MKTSSVCNQKRGVGEFLVADEIAFSFEQSGIPMSFYDLDVQGGTLHRTHEVNGAEVAVVDTPGGRCGRLSPTGSRRPTLWSSPRALHIVTSSR